MFIVVSSSSGHDPCSSGHKTDESDSDCDPVLASSSNSLKSHDNSATNHQCTSQCCKDREFPFQPRAAHTKKRQGKQNRSFNTRWYRDHRWISFCTSQEKVFCFYCRKAAHEGLLPSGSRIDSSLIMIGFGNWKKAKYKFKAHEKSKTHRDALFAYKALK